ncbi:hypothetical protein V8E53_006756 [Lactarius tabidus]
MSNSSTLPPYVVAFLPLALKEQSVIAAERYISAVGFTVFIYDLLLTLGDEIQYIWRRPVTNIKVLYLILRYGVAIAQVVYFQGFGSDKRLDIARDSQRPIPRFVGPEASNTILSCVGSLIVLAVVGSMSLILANCKPELSSPVVAHRFMTGADIMLIRVYALWDHRKWMLQTLYVGYSISVCSTIAFVATSIVQLAPHVIHDSYLFHMCLITTRTPYWIGIWLSQALFDVFLFVLTIFNAASRPRRANVKIITDLRRDGCVFYLGLFVGRFLNVALSIPTSKQYYPIAVSFVLSLSTVTVTRLVLRLERLLVTRGSGRDMQVTDWMYNSYELRSSY